MAHLQEVEPRRRADGSIDTDFYAARADAIRRKDQKWLGKRLFKLLTGCAEHLRALQTRKSRA